MAEKAEQAAANGHMRIVYQITKTIAGKYGKPSVPVKDKQGQPIFDPNGQSERWKEHFEEFLKTDHFQKIHLTYCQPEEI